MFKNFSAVILLTFCLSFLDAAEFHPTPSARTCPELNGAYVTGEFLYWKARQDGLVFAAVLAQTSSATEIDRSFKPIDAGFRYDPGFKLGLGGNLPYDGWDLSLIWTHFHTVPSVSKSSADPVFIDWEAIQEEEEFVGRKLKQSWNLMFNALDFEAGRRFYLSNTLSMRPSFGGKVVWIHNKIRRDILDVVALLDGRPGLPDKARFGLDFWGIGPSFGFQSKWTFAYGLGLLGEFSAALLWGKFDLTVFQSTGQLQQVGVSEFIADIAFTSRRVRPTTQFFLGLDWEWCFIPKWLSVNLRAGYETQVFWSQFFNVVQDIWESDLTFEGFTFMGRIDF